MRRLLVFTVCLLAATAAFGQQKNAAKKGPKNAAEQKALQALDQAQTPDDKIKAADDFIAKFTTSDFKSAVLYQEAEAYQRKNNATQAVVYGEQALQADPKNFAADDLLANIIAQTTRENDLDKAEKIKKADKYAHDALASLDADNRPFTTPEDQWPKVKAVATAQSWRALGLIALLKKNNDEAVTDFQKGIDTASDPVLLVLLGRAQIADNKPDDAMATFQKVMSDPDAPQQIKTIAQADRVRAFQASKAKSPAVPASAPPAPAAPAPAAK